MDNVYGRYASFFKSYELKEADKYIKRVFPNAEFYIDYEHALVFERIGEDKEIEQTYLSLQKNIKFVCTNKDLMNSMLDELDYIVYASKLYGGKHVMEELDNRYKNKLMS